MSALHSLYLDGTDLERNSEAFVRFRLTYAGPLKSTQPGHYSNVGGVFTDKRGEQKHVIRRDFHRQLKQFWATNKFLNTARMMRGGAPMEIVVPGDVGRDVREYNQEQLVSIVEAISGRYHENGYHFVPLVRQDWSLACSLRILFLRRDEPGSVYTAGDIDNRVKTIIDALTKPTGSLETGPQDDEDPFFVLLENDKLVTHLEVDTDRLLDPPAKSEDLAQTRLVITVEIRPYDITMFNLGFSS